MPISLYDQSAPDPFGGAPAAQPDQQPDQQQPQAPSMAEALTGPGWSNHVSQVFSKEQMQQMLSGASSAGLAPELQGLTGKDFVNKLAETQPTLAARLQRVARGDEPYPTGRAQNIAQNRALINMLGIAYPDYSAQTYQQKAAQKKNYQAGGKQFQEMQAIGTVSGHMQDMMQAADALQNYSGLGPLNAPINSLVQSYRELSQDPRIVTFNTVKNAVTRELTKAYQGGHITDSSVAEWQQSLNAAETPQQLKAVIGKLNDLLESKRRILQSGWDSTMGDAVPDKDWSAESTKVKGAFDKVNAWAHPELTNQTAAPAAAQPQAAQPVTAIPQSALLAEARRRGLIK